MQLSWPHVLIASVGGTRFPGGHVMNSLVDRLPSRFPGRHPLRHRGPAAGRRRSSYLDAISGVSGRPAGPAAVRQGRAQERAEKPPSPRPQRRRPKIVGKTGNAASARTLLKRRRVACPSPPPLSHPATGTLAPSGAGVLVIRACSRLFPRTFPPQKTPSDRFPPASGSRKSARHANPPAQPCPTTRSSRCTISARPPKPRIERMSADERPLILSASSAS